LSDYATNGAGRGKAAAMPGLFRDRLRHDCSCNSADDGHDAGGLFVVIGNVECDQFIGQYGKCVFVDGNLEVTQIILNCFEDSSLSVTGNLRTRFFYAWDQCGEVGGRAEMEYGHGYCLPFGPRESFTRAMIKPHHDADTSLRLLAVQKPGYDIGSELVKLVRAGRSPFLEEERR
jgi:hypothetical protein